LPPLPFHLMTAAVAWSWMEGGCEDVVAQRSIGELERAYTTSEGASVVHVYTRGRYQRFHDQ
jgi:hypothetical protein